MTEPALQVARQVRTVRTATARTVAWQTVLGCLLAQLFWPTVTMAQEGPGPLAPAGATPAQYPPCTTQADDAATAAAQGAFQAGSASFNEADYPRAIFYWEDAYRRDCTAHLMLKNLARAYELNEQYEQAILALRTYVERNPDSGETEAIERRIENLERKLEERNAAAAAPVEKEPPAKAPPPKPVPQESGNDEIPEFGEMEADEGRSVVPLVFAGAGAAAGILGGVQWMIAKKDESDAAANCGDGGRKNCLPDAQVAGNDALDRQVLWGIVGGVGGAVTVAGVIWYFAQSDGSDEESMTRVVPEFGSGYAGVRWFGGF